MKIIVNIIRVLVGALFIFSGLVKANDPLGLAYKMQEFFEAWHWLAFNNYALFMSVTMNVLEVSAGMALLIGWQRKFTNLFLLLLILFFTFLTSYVLFSGKITNCGCFGDCIPLTPIQTFAKDVALLLMIVLLVFQTNKLNPIFSETIASTIVVLSIVATIAMQLFVLKHLPFVDCLPYKKGNSILEQMKIPQGAVPDSFQITYQYKKDNKTVEFNANHFPDDFDSTYVYINRVNKLIRKGNATPKIVDFALKTISDVDTTKEIFAQTQPYILLFAKELPKNKNIFENKVFEAIKANHIPLFVVTADGNADSLHSNYFTILKCDVTVIKTAARVNPTYMFMKQDTIMNKISYADEDKILKAIHSISKP
ncbi:MAG: DoxX family membrane protein [Bacteroidetes bacterium]|nr:DoxX family membrane protein [Bacteroidota bacterium]MBS1649713.1 DoxX family membrane protein [Bacteroidota bacterium]